MTDIWDAQTLPTGGKTKIYQACVEWASTTEHDHIVARSKEELTHQLAELLRDSWENHSWNGCDADECPEIPTEDDDVIEFCFGPEHEVSKGDADFMFEERSIWLDSIA